MLTSLAIIGILRTHGIATVIAGDTVPVAKRNVGAILAIRTQDTPDQGEEVADSAFFNRCSNGGTAISFAEFFTVDMRMSD